MFNLIVKGKVVLFVSNKWELDEQWRKRLSMEFDQSYGKGNWKVEEAP